MKTLYSLVGFSSLLIYLIINKDIIFNRSDLPKSYRYYRAFLFVIMTFFIIDAVWGILDGVDFINRDELLNEFNEIIDNNIMW